MKCKTEMSKPIFWRKIRKILSAEVLPSVTGGKFIEISVTHQSRLDLSSLLEIKMNINHISVNMTINNYDTHLYMFNIDLCMTHFN